MLHPTAGPVQPWGERSVDRELYPACALPALYHRRHARFPRLWILARLSLLDSGLRRGRGVRKAAPEPAREDRADRRDGAGDGLAHLRLARAPASHIMN